MGDASADNGVLTTTSRPERPVYVLLTGLLFLPLAIVAVVFLTDNTAEMSGSAIMTCAIAFVVTVISFATIVLLKVHIRASASEGLTVSLARIITRQLPWEAIASIEKAPTGGAIDVGWKWIGTGRIGYLAGAENILVKIKPEFRERVQNGEITVQGNSKLAEWYYISVPESEQVATELNRMLQQSSATARPDNR